MNNFNRFCKCQSTPTGGLIVSIKYPMILSDSKLHAYPCLKRKADEKPCEFFGRCLELNSIRASIQFGNLKTRISISCLMIKSLRVMVRSRRIFWTLAFILRNQECVAFQSTLLKRKNSIPVLSRAQSSRSFRVRPSPQEDSRILYKRKHNLCRELTKCSAGFDSNDNPNENQDANNNSTTSTKHIDNDDDFFSESIIDPVISAETPVVGVLDLGIRGKGADMEEMEDSMSSSQSLAFNTFEREDKRKSRGFFSRIKRKFSSPSISKNQATKSTSGEEEASKETIYKDGQLIGINTTRDLDSPAGNLIESQFLNQTQEETAFPSNIPKEVSPASTIQLVSLNDLIAKDTSRTLASLSNVSNTSNSSAEAKTTPTSKTNIKKDVSNSFLSRWLKRGKKKTEELLSADEIRRAKLKLLEDDGRQTHNAPSLRRLLERETLRLGEAAEVFNISSTAAALMEQAQARKRTLIRNVESKKKGGMGLLVRALISPAGWSGKLKYVSLLAFLLLVAPIPKRFSVSEPPSTNSYGDSTWTNKYRYNGKDSQPRRMEQTPNPAQTQEEPSRIYEQHPSLDDMPMKYAQGPIQKTLEPEPLDQQRHYVSSFVAKAVRKVGPSVIRIDTERYVDSVGPNMVPKSPAGPFFGIDDFEDGDDNSNSRPIEQGQGSGIIFSSDGLVLTNAHVVEGASRVTVTLTDGRRFVAEVKGQDEMVDLAVLQIVSTSSSNSPGLGSDLASGENAQEQKDASSKRRWEGEPLPVAAFGNSETVEVGEWVIAVGNPVGLDNTVTMGIISSVKRSSAEVGIPNKKVEFIQTDAAINPGNSGGPLVNEHGDIIGINTCIRANAEGIGFAIPINKAKSIMYDLAEGRNVQHGYIGIVMTTVTPDFAKQNNGNPNSPAGVMPEVHGALVMRVLANTPASECGLRRFDVIMEMNGVRVKNASEAQSVVDEAPVGRDMTLKILRGEKELELKVKPGDLGQKIRQAKEKERQKQQSFLPPGLIPHHGEGGGGGRIYIFPIPGQ